MGHSFQKPERLTGLFHYYVMSIDEEEKTFREVSGLNHFTFKVITFTKLLCISVLMSNIRGLKIFSSWHSEEKALK